MISIYLILVRGEWWGSTRIRALEGVWLVGFDSWSQHKSGRVRDSEFGGRGLCADRPREKQPKGPKREWGNIEGCVHDRLSYQSRKLFGNVSLDGETTLRSATDFEIWAIFSTKRFSRIITRQQQSLSPLHLKSVRVHNSLLSDLLAARVIPRR